MLELGLQHLRRGPLLLVHPGVESSGPQPGTVIWVDGPSVTARTSAPPAVAAFTGTFQLCGLAVTSARRSDENSLWRSVTTVLPPASAGASFHAIIIIG